MGRITNRFVVALVGGTAGAVSMCFLVPLMLAVSLVVSMPLTDMLTNRGYFTAVFVAGSMLIIAVIAVAHVITLLLLLVCLKKHVLLVSLSAAVSFAAFYIYLQYHAFLMVRTHSPDVPVKLFIETVAAVLLVLAATLVISLSWRRKRRIA